MARVPAGRSRTVSDVSAASLPSGSTTRGSVASMSDPRISPRSTRGTSPACVDRTSTADSSALKTSTSACRSSGDPRWTVPRASSEPAAAGAGLDPARLQLSVGGGAAPHSRRVEACAGRETQSRVARVAAGHRKRPGAASPSRRSTAGAGGFRCEAQLHALVDRGLTLLAGCRETQHHRATAGENHHRRRCAAHDLSYHAGRPRARRTSAGHCGSAFSAPDR